MKRCVGRVAFCLVFSLAAVASAQERRELRFPDPPGLRTLKCDFHLHTVFSDGLVWPTVRVDEAWRQGLDAIAITDHIEYIPHKDDLPLKSLNRSYELALPRARERNILLIRGAEITRETPPGHFNAIFVKDVDPLKTDDLFEVFQRATGQGGFLFWNHPYWQGPEKGQWAEVQQKAYDKKQLGGIEICNGDEYCAQAHAWAVEKGLTVVGNTDEHQSETTVPFTPEVHRTVTLVFAGERSVEAIQEALVAGRTAVWCKNMLYGPEPGLAAMFAGAVEARPIHRRTKEDVYFEVVNRCELDVQLSIGKKKAERPRVLPAGATTLWRLNKDQLNPEGEIAIRVENFLTAPDQVLVTKLQVPSFAATQPATAN